MFALLISLLQLGQMYVKDGCIYSFIFFLFLSPVVFLYRQHKKQIEIINVNIVLQFFFLFFANVNLFCFDTGAGHISSL